MLLITIKKVLITSLFVFFFNLEFFCEKKSYTNLIWVFLQNRYSCYSVVWSFGVVLWEITSLAAAKPFYYLNDAQVLQNAECMFYGEELQVSD